LSGGNDLEVADEITIGAWVFTSDGRELGRVKKTETGAFQVDAPLAFDYWLDRTLVKGATEERVDLLIANSDLHGYKMDNPTDQDGFHD
jgi:hypothetical protein